VSSPITSRYQYEQTVAAYVQQVIVAYGEVEDALTDLRMFTEEVGLDQPSTRVS
jgi:hypothetical protein